jgi:hypothetical protein
MTFNRKYLGTRCQRNEQEEAAESGDADGHAECLKLNVRCRKLKKDLMPLACPASPIYTRNECWLWFISQRENVLII